MSAPHRPLNYFPEPPLDPPDSERPMTLPERLAWLRRNPNAEPDDGDEFA